MMKLTSRFLFTGAAVLALVFSVNASWILLPLALLVAFLGLMSADREQIEAMDSAAIGMLLARHERPLLPLDPFCGQELLFYQAGTPVYRYLIASDSRWSLVGEQDEVAAERGTIRVFPGFVYRREEERAPARHA